MKFAHQDGIRSLSDACFILMMLCTNYVLLDDLQRLDEPDCVRGARVNITTGASWRCLCTKCTSRSKREPAESDIT